MQNYDNYFKKYYEENREDIREYQKKYRSQETVKKKNREQYLRRKEEGAIKRPPRQKEMWYQAKYRSAKNNTPFDIEVDDVEMVDVCPILGIELDQKGNRESTSSLDRIIPKLGYVKGNVRVISNKANRMKGDHTLETAKALVRYLEEST